MSASLAIDEFAFFPSQLQFLRFEFDFPLVTHRNAFPFAFVATGLKFLNEDLFSFSMSIPSVGLDIDVLFAIRNRLIKCVLRKPHLGFNYTRRI